MPAGPLIFTIVASSLGLAFAAIAGVTAVALFLPAAIFIGATVAAFSVVGSLLSLVRNDQAASLEAAHPCPCSTFALSLSSLLLHLRIQSLPQKLRSV